MSIFCDRFKQLKDESKKLLKDLSVDTGITVPNLSYYMKGREPNYDVLVKIANYFNVTTDYLVGRTNQRNYEAEQIAQSIQAKSNTEIDNVRRQSAIENDSVKLHDLLIKLAEMETEEKSMDSAWEMIDLWLDGFESYLIFLKLDSPAFYPLDEAKKAMDILTKSRNVAFDNVSDMIKRLLKDDEADKELKNRCIVNTSFGILPLKESSSGHEQK